MINEYLKQVATWKKKTGHDMYGGNTYTSQSILARVEEIGELIRSKTGEQVVSRARIILVSPVEVGDVINVGGEDWEVIKVETKVDLEGKEVYRIVWI